MKIIFNFNKVVLVSLSIMGLFFSSCIKNYRDGETNFSGLQPTVSIVEGGLNQFSSQALVYPGTDIADTTIFRVNYAATNVASTNEVVGLAIDSAAVSAYNAANSLTGDNAYQVLPDSVYSYNTTSTTVATGQTFSPAIPFILFPSKIDPTISYMLPIKISSAPSGAIISGNFGEIYYHVIGNPIAGNYNGEWIRWNETDSSGSPDYDYTGLSTPFSPTSPTEVYIQTQVSGVSYYLDFENNGGVLSNFTISLDPSTFAAAGVATLTSGPTIEITDPINGVYRFTYAYINTSGLPRIVVDYFVK